MTMNNNDKEQDFLKIKEADNFGSPYYYAERKGKDSVAFILFDEGKARIGDEKFLGLIREYKPPIKQWLVTAFGGSLDKDDKPILDTVIEEVREESGYAVKRSDIVSIGKYFVSTQMNQFCHLYFVTVNQSKFKGRLPEGVAEERAEVEWLSLEDITKLEDWKSLLIASRVVVKQHLELEKAMKRNSNNVIMPSKDIIH